MPDAARQLAVVVATFTILMGMLYWIIADRMDYRHRPNRDIDTGDTVSRVELAPNPAGQYIVPGRINGIDVHFLLDTGASHVAIPDRLAEKLQLQRGAPIQVETAAGRVTAYRTVIDRIALGGIEQRGVRGSLNPDLAGNEILLGMSFLRHVEFRQVGERLILEQP